MAVERGVLAGVESAIEGSFIPNVETHTVSNTEVQLLGFLYVNRLRKTGIWKILLLTVFSRPTLALLEITANHRGAGHRGEALST